MITKLFFGRSLSVLCALVVCSFAGALAHGLFLNRSLTPITLFYLFALFLLSFWYAVCQFYMIMEEVFTYGNQQHFGNEYYPGNSGKSH